MIDEDLLLKQHRMFNYNEVEIAEKVFRLKLWETQKPILKEFFKKDKDGKPFYQERLLICGKKSSKTFMTAVSNLILIYRLVLMEDFFKFFNLIPQDVYLLNTCAGKDQSIKVYLNQVKGILTLSEFMREFKVTEKTDEIHFKIPGYKFHFVLKAQSSRSTSSLGYLCFSVTFDELQWFQDTNNRSSSKEAYGALYPNIKPFGGYGYSFILTSPGDIGGWFYSHYNFALNSPKKLVIERATWEMNPAIKEKDLEEEKIRDYDKWRMDWKGEFIESEGGAFNTESVEKAMHLDVRDISVKDKKQRMIALDPGLVRDAYALAMGYIDDNYKVYVDYVHYWIGSRTNPVKIKEVEEHLEYLYKQYKISKIVLDQKYSANTIQRLGDKGFPIFETFFDSGYKQKMYQTFKEKLNMNEVFLPRDEKVKNELIALKRKGSGANIRYEAPTVGAIKTDDMADAIANCVYQLSLLNEEGEGTDDFAIEGNVITYQEEKKQNNNDEEFEKKQIEQIEKNGGFAIG